MREVVFSRHAEEALRLRQIERDWVLEALSSPDYLEADPSPRRLRDFRRISQFGNRWLRVVYEEDSDRQVVVTAFFDRRAEKST